MKRVAFLTSGGDCQALNATMRGVAKALYAADKDIEIYGILEGYKGLIYGNYRKMEPSDFSGILTLGGTILGSSRQPFKHMRKPDANGLEDVYKRQLLILTSVLGYELKTAVGTSVFIMTFTALTGAVSHFWIGGKPDMPVFVLCVIFTLLWARIAAKFANKAEPKTLNRATGLVLVILGIVIMGFQVITK